MKVVPQIITFLIVIAIGWFAYERHEAFRSLVDDIVDHSGLTRQITPPVSEYSQPSVASSADATRPTQTAEVSDTVADADPEPEMVKASPEHTVAQKGTEQEPEPAKEKVIWPDEVQSIDTENQWVKPEKQAASKDHDVKPETKVLESTIKPVPQADEAQALKETVNSSSAQSLPQKPVLAAPVVDDASATNGKDALGQLPIVEDDEKSASSTRKQQALAGLAAARAAWHQGNHDNAVQLYIELIREYKNHPDFAGELGNIYFSKGQTELAVNAYSEAFLRLLRNKDIERAQQVLGIVYNIDQEQAALLKEYFAR